MSEVVLITGATGFIGTQVALELLKRQGASIVTLVRAQGQEEAERKARRHWWDWPVLTDEIGKRITVVPGDVSKEKLNLPEAVYSGLVRSLTHIIHSAAEVRLDIPEEQIRLVNVQGTANIITLAREVHRDHGLSRFSHLSTAYVAGKRTGDVWEEELTDRFGFSSAYERSKFEAERLVREIGQELPISVFRPGMVVGDSKTGYVRNFNTLYVPIRLYLTRRSHVIPINPAMRVNFVPVDYVAEAVVSLTFESRAEGSTFHLTANAEKLPSVREMLALVREWARKKARLSPPRPLFVPLPSLAKRSDGALGVLSPYFDENRKFKRENTERLLGPSTPKWRDLLPRLLDFALNQGFFHRSTRTVHEQVLFRLASQSRPVKYFDIIDGVAMERQATSIRVEMLEAATALRDMGVRPQDRVAIIGLNSTRYLTLDVAIGLAGAVSVPLYHTSPIAEIDGIIKSSGVKILLVGAPWVLECLGELRSEVTVISFCRGEIPSTLRPNVTCWEDFLRKGKDKVKVTEAPVTPEDLATLRFTSGTTGFPKGVEFTHRAVRWMAEVGASLLPFNARSNKIVYLSFLPMNHVIEGILSTYAPYYTPASLSIYFLEDFRQLAQTLPDVRPSIFFSVPRVYEKLWEGLRASSIGRRYVNSRGIMRSMLRGLVHHSLLKKTGLDRCAQLIVGWAPVSEELLLNLRDLGIEVHNAYGLTEAPLVTLNRLGANRIGTVGQPLPETEIKVAPDGEILVRGPQITAGYFGEKEQPFRDGWLLTGDLGWLDKAGHLVIEGRRKELLGRHDGHDGVRPRN